MADFSSGVSAPGGVNYAAPLMNFSNFSNWAADDPSKKIFDQQAQQLNAQRIAQGQTAIDVANVFKNGLPTDPKTGQTDYWKAISMMAKAGDPNAIFSGADAAAVQSASNLSPLLGGGGPPAPAGGPPALIPARPLPPPPAGTPQGDTGSGTITDIVTDRMPGQDTATGQTILKLSQVLGVDPNVPLTPGQLKRAQVLLNRYAPAAGGDGGGGAAPKPQMSDDGTGSSFDSRFGAAGGGNLPPSANAVSPAPPPAPPRQAAGPAPAAGAPPPAPVQGVPQGAPVPAPGPQAVPPQPVPAGGPGQPVPQAAPGQPAPQPQPATPQGGPIVPQVPLPPGYTDPQQAILALRREAARLASNPRAKGQVDQLTNWAQRIEDSIKPVETRPGETMRDPRTGEVIFREPLAKQPNPQQLALQRYLDEHPDATAEEIQKFNAQSRPARSAAAMSLQRYLEENPGATSDDIQNFQASQAGKSAGARTGAVREENLKLILKVTNSAIPAALEQSEKVGRTTWTPLNKIIQKGQVISSDGDLASFGMANLQLAEGWAKAMNPTGVMRESDRDKALEFLNTSTSAATYKRLVLQLQTQIQRELAAVQSGKGSTEVPEPGKLTDAQKGSATTTPGGFNWSVLPDKTSDASSSGQKNIRLASDDEDNENIADAFEKALRAAQDEPEPPSQFEGMTNKQIEKAMRKLLRKPVIS